MRLRPILLSASLGLLAACASDGDRPPVLTLEGWADAPSLGEVSVIPNRDSVRIEVPAVAAAADYRVIVVEPGVTVTSARDGSEDVRGAVIVCAGRAQHAAPARETGNPVLRTIEVTGLTGPVQLAVEAIDRECPFTGVLGASHVELESSEGAVEAGTPPTFPLVTPDEIRARHGSLILNGHGPGEELAMPAAPSIPRVLARTLVEVTPRGTGDRPLPFWDDFADARDVFTAVGRYPRRDGSDGAHWHNARWNLYAMGTSERLSGAGGAPVSQAFPFRGTMVMTVDDWAQEIFGVTQLVPRRPVHLADDAYLHVTFETTIGPTDRRYPWFTLCGAQAAGGTFDADGHVRGRMDMWPFFYQADGLSPYVEGWQCLQVFPFEGGYYGLPPDDRKPETSIKVLVNRPHEGRPQDRDNVINVGPPAYGPDDRCAWCGWYGALDAVQRTAPRVRFDLYVRRDRVILYADGAPRLCNDFPGARLTMPEAALGLGQILYHSTAEHAGFAREDWVRDGQRYYLTNSPWVDQRGWDNVGFEEGVAAPAGFDERGCYRSTAR